MIIGHPIPVRPGCHAQLRFSTPSPPGARLFIEYRHKSELLSREVRPLAPGDRSVELKTHPEGTHIACSLVVAGHPISGVTFEAHCNRNIEAVTRYFIVIGAMKAGTTTLFELLSKHPSLCRTWTEVPGISFTKEINYFSSLHRAGDIPAHYDWRFPFDPEKHAWTLDVSPNYSKWPLLAGVPSRIASLGGEVRIAYILREPVDRIESHIAHSLRVGRDPRLKLCLHTSQYAMQLDRFLAAIPRNKILLLDFVQLERNPTVVLEQVCEFLGIEKFSAHTMIHNRREYPFRLKANQRDELSKALRPDVDRLINFYGFQPAKSWLKPSLLGRLQLLRFRRRSGH